MSLAIYINPFLSHEALVTTIYISFVSSKSDYGCLMKKWVKQVCASIQCYYRIPCFKRRLGDYMQEMEVSPLRYSCEQSLLQGVIVR